MNLGEAQLDRGQPSATLAHALARTRTHTCRHTHSSHRWTLAFQSHWVCKPERRALGIVFFNLSLYRRLKGWHGKLKQIWEARLIRTRWYQKAQTLKSELECVLLPAPRRSVFYPVIRSYFHSPNLAETLSCHFSEACHSHLCTYVLFFLKCLHLPFWSEVQFHICQNGCTGLFV